MLQLKAGFCHGFLPELQKTTEAPTSGFLFANEVSHCDSLFSLLLR